MGGRRSGGDGSLDQPRHPIQARPAQWVVAAAQTVARRRKTRSATSRRSVEVRVCSRFRTLTGSSRGMRRARRIARDTTASSLRT